MSQQSLFTTVSLLSATPSLIYVQTGFTPGRIELIDLTRATTPTATQGWKSLWQTGMVQGSSLNTIYSATPSDETIYNATNGISLLNQLGAPEVATYGPTISAFTNANPGVISVNSTYPAQITAGCIIRVALLADNQAGTQSLNGDYYVASVTPTSITLGTAPAGLWTQTVLSNPNTTGYSVYVSGGVVTLLQTAFPTMPNPPYNVYSDVPSWYNQSIQGFTIGTSCFPNAGYSLTTPDLILVSAWDQMQP